jgi:hypothetical protein
MARVPYRRIFSCAAKRRFETKLLAKAHASMFEQKTWAYRCDYCRGWHLTRKKPSRPSRLEK